MAYEKKQSKGFLSNAVSGEALKGMINTAQACKWEDILGM